MVNTHFLCNISNGMSETKRPQEAVDNQLGIQFQILCFE